uniref:TLC domain-containing protein n=1 Tax=Heterorhabditis bacteriophora TaxID=37862 RepID=A0A1I7XMF5_HETBA
MFFKNYSWGDLGYYEWVGKQSSVLYYWYNYSYSVLSLEYLLLLLQYLRCTFHFRNLLMKHIHWNTTGFVTKYCEIVKTRKMGNRFDSEKTTNCFQIFYACVATVAVLVLWLLMCYFIKKKAAQSRRRREQAIKVKSIL